MKSQRYLIAPSALLLVALCPPAGAEIAPVGEELSVASGTIASRLVAPAVTFNAAGEHLVAWEGFRQGLVGRLLDAGGRPFGPEVRLAANDLPPSVPYRGPMTLRRTPSVVGLDTGGELAVWTEELHLVSVDVFYQKSAILTSKIVSQRLNQRGRPVGPLTVLSDADLGLAGSPRAVHLAAGQVLVVWHHAEGGGEPGIYGRLLSRRGVPIGPSFRVDSPGSPPGSRPAVAAADDGGALVAWNSCCDGDGPGIYGRLYKARAEPVGEPFRINTTQAGMQVWPAVAQGAAGEHLVAWMGPGEAGSPLEFLIYGQVLAADGTLLGPELTISQGQGRLHGAPAIVGTADGYLAAWILWGRDFPVAVLGRELDGAGVPMGDLLRLSSGPLGVQWSFSLAADGRGGYFAAWEGFDAKGAPSINARRLTERD